MTKKLDNFKSAFTQRPIIAYSKTQRPQIPISFLTFDSDIQPELN